MLQPNPDERIEFEELLGEEIEEYI